MNSAQYMAERRHLAASCEFENLLYQALRDRLVCGLRNETILKRLLCESSTSLAGILKVAQALEVADKTAQSFKPTDAADVDQVSQNYQGGHQKRASQEEKPCYHCGRVWQQCKFRQAICHACHKRGTWPEYVNRGVEVLREPDGYSQILQVLILKLSLGS